MSGFIKCVIYFAATGVLSFFLGRVLPKSWFSYNEFPYRLLPVERDGKLYDALGIRRWKDKLPDMSRILPGFIPSKRPGGSMTAAQADRMLQETCVAECIHTLLCITGCGCLFLWPGYGGRVLYAIYVLGNIPFNLIQRYNRPKLARIARRLHAKEARIEGSEADEKRFDIELQYGART